jgi:hypothetical protein
MDSIQPIQLGRIWLAGLVAITAALVANLIFLFVLRAVVSIPPEFPPLNPAPIAIFVISFLVIGVIVYYLTARFSRNPVRTYWLLAAVALVISILPNLSLMFNPASAPFPGGSAMTWGALILFHILTFFIFVPILVRMSTRAS